MKVLLSIKPEFANKIFEGTKRFEFRKSIFKKEVKTVVVYASSPLQQVIGEFEVERILHLELDTLWDMTHKESGISENFFYKYFERRLQSFTTSIICLSIGNDFLFIISPNSNLLKNISFI